MSAPSKPRGACYALMHAVSILVCEDARRRGIEAPVMCVEGMHRALRNVDDEVLCGELVECAIRMLEILGGSL